MSKQEIPKSFAMCERFWQSSEIRRMVVVAFIASFFLPACTGENPDTDGGFRKNNYSAADPVKVGWTVINGSNWRADEYQIGATPDFSKFAVVMLCGGVVTWADTDKQWITRSSSSSIFAFGNWFGNRSDEKADEKCWKAVSASGGGNLVVAARGSYIFTSPDMGVNWVLRKTVGLRDWQSVTVSPDGKKVAAIATDGHVFVSTNSGDTWVDRPLYTAAPKDTRIGQAIASSSDGKYLAAIVNGGHLYTSDNFGDTWVDRSLTVEVLSGERGWRDITSSADGSKLAAVVNPGRIYTSNNYGVTWVQRTSVYGAAGGDKLWTSIASSPDGTRLVAVEYDRNQGNVWDSERTIEFTGHVFVSANSGELWTDVTEIGGPASYGYKWGKVISSGDGNKFALITRSDPNPPNGVQFLVFIMEIKTQ